MKRIELISSLLIFTATALAPFAHAAPAAPKIATVNLQKALQSVKQGKAARTKLESQVAKRQKEIRQKEEALRKAQQELQKQSLVLNEKAKAEKYAEFQQQFAQFQEFARKTNEEFAKKEQELTSPIITRLRKMVDEIAKKKGYTMVLDKSANMVLYSLAQDDLTTDLIKSYDKKNK